MRQLPNVEFVGYLSRNELIDFLGNAKFLINTSHYEGFSNTFQEAMVCGTPILTTENVNPDQIVQKFNIGFVYSNPVDLSSKLNQLSEKEYDKMSNNCTCYVEDYHNNKTLAKRLVDFLKTI